MPTHYSFKVGNGLASLSQQYERVSQLTGEQLAKLRTPAPDKPKLTPQLEAQARQLVDALDERGAWVEDGRLRYHGDADDTRRVIDSSTFIKNLGVLSRYVGSIGR
jgi:hypothetical protein